MRGLPCTVRTSHRWICVQLGNHAASNALLFCSRPFQTTRYVCSVTTFAFRGTRHCSHGRLPTPAVFEKAQSQHNKGTRTHARAPKPPGRLGGEPERGRAPQTDRAAPGPRVASESLVVLGCGLSLWEGSTRGDDASARFSLCSAPVLARPPAWHIVWRERAGDAANPRGTAGLGWSWGDGVFDVFFSWAVNRGS